MNRVSRRTLLSGSFATAALLGLQHHSRTAAFAAQADDSYDMVDFGPLTEGVLRENASRPDFGGPTGITGDGTIFGKIGVSAERFSPAIWDKAGALKRLKSGEFGGTVLGMNSQGDAVGQLYAAAGGGDSDTLNTPAAWIDGDLVKLPLPEPRESYYKAQGSATGISDDGVIVGNGSGYNLRWINGQPEPISGTDSFFMSQGTRIVINAKGTIAAGVIPADGGGAVPAILHPDQGEISPVEMPEEFAKSYVTLAAINGVDTLLSYAITDVFLGFLTGSGKITTTLDLRPTGGSFRPLALNDTNDVIGNFQARAVDPYVPAIWHAGETAPVPLAMPASSKLTLYSVAGISNDGAIAGIAYTSDAVLHPVLLVPKSA